jgi:hypothetical protein
MNHDRQLLRENLFRAKFLLLEAQDEVISSLRKLWPAGFLAQECPRWDHEASCKPVTIIDVINAQFVLVEDVAGNRHTVHPDDLFDDARNSF